jgi:polysaccharide chain length determinant protein (PEP-CTERM system associated)
VIPGKTYTPEDVIRLFWRHPLMVILPCLLVGTAAVLYSQWLPDQYQSESLILVVPQRVPDSYVRSTVTIRIEDQLQALSHEVLSRTELEHIVREFGLYPRMKNADMQTIAERMRRDITIEIVRGDAFRVKYTSDRPDTAMRVTDRLASLFINGSAKDRETLAEGTNQFLDIQLEDARARLVEHEKKLEEFRRRYAGQLPSEVESNLQAIRSTELQLQALGESVNRNRDQKVLVERQIADVNLSGPSGVPVDRTADPAQAGLTLDQQLEIARSQLSALEARFTAAHPDVIRAKRRVADLEQKVADQATDQPTTPTGGADYAERARRNRLNDLRAQLDNLNRDISQQESEEKRLRAVIADYQTRVAAAPTRESDLVALTRDYDTLQKVYTDLLGKREESKIAANLEKRQVGQQFKIQDPANLPEKRSGPDRLLISAAGALAGLVLGFGLVGIREYRDSSLRQPSDVFIALSLPVLASVPLISTAQERRTHRRAVWLASLTSVAVVVCAAVLLIWKLHI